MAFMGKGCVSECRKLEAAKRALNDYSLDFLSASRSKNSGSTALASAVLPSVLGVFMCLAHNDWFSDCIQIYTLQQQARIHRKSVSGVCAVRQGSTLPLLSAAALQLTLEHSACFIKTDILWTRSGRRVVIYGLCEEKVSDSLHYR